MNRVTIQINEHGEIGRICSDEPIEFYFVSPHTPHDRVYLYGAVEVGPQFVREEIGGYAVGHFDDCVLGGDEPHLPPSRPALKPVS